MDNLVHAQRKRPTPAAAIGSRYDLLSNFAKQHAASFNTRTPIKRLDLRKQFPDLPKLAATPHQTPFSDLPKQKHECQTWSDTIESGLSPCIEKEFNRQVLKCIRDNPRIMENHFISKSETIRKWSGTISTVATFFMMLITMFRDSLL